MNMFDFNFPYLNFLSRLLSYQVPQYKYLYNPYSLNNKCDIKKLEARNFSFRKTLCAIAAQNELDSKYIIFAIETA